MFVSSIGIMARVRACMRACVCARARKHIVKYCIGIFMWAYIYYVMIDLYFILCMPIIVLL